VVTNNASGDTHDTVLDSQNDFCSLMMIKQMVDQLVRGMQRKNEAKLAQTREKHEDTKNAPSRPSGIAFFNR